MSTAPERLMPSAGYDSAMHYHYYMVDIVDGDYVRYSDYAALEAENAKLRAELEQAYKWLKDLYIEGYIPTKDDGEAAAWVTRNTPPSERDTQVSERRCATPQCPGCLKFHAEPFCANDTQLRTAEGKK